MGQCQGKEDVNDGEKVDLTITTEDQIVQTSAKQTLEEPVKETKENEENPQMEFKEEAPAEPEKEKEAEGTTCIVSIGMVRGCREVSWLPKTGTGSEFFVVVRIEDKDDELVKTSATKDTIWPSWRETSSVPWKKGENLEFELMETLYNCYDIKGQIKETQTIVAGRGVLKSADFENGGFNGTVLMDSRIHLDTLLRVKVSHPGQDAPPDPEMEFTLNFDKAGGKYLGLQLDQSDGKMLCIRGVQDGGVVAAYNKEVAKDKQIQPRDFICSVNGTSGSAADMYEALKGEKVELLIKRSMECGVGVPPYKPRDLHGMEFHKDVTMEWLLVTNIKDKLNAAQYNAQEDFKDYQIMAGDRLVRAFGTRAGFGSDIARTARFSAGLQCEVFRPFDAAHPHSVWYRF